MIRNRRPLPPRQRGGFTLVEMLVAVTIVAILAAMVFAAMAAAENTAKIAKTRATIAKLHRLIMARYESYKTRRVPIDMFLRADTNQAINPPLTPAQMAQVRLEAIREIMRMELPERAADVVTDPTSSAVGPFTSSGWARISPSTSGRKVLPTGLCLAYRSYWQQQEAQGRRWREDTVNTHTSAECLYLIVTMACPGGRQQFSENEIADVDRDGWPEFIDGWGRPIYFARWAPGFIPTYDADSVLQTDARLPGRNDQVKQHDPFDTQRLEPFAYQLIPLIYSAGPDGESYICMPDQNRYSSWLRSGNRTPYTLRDSRNRLSGCPGDVNSASTIARKHFDNIHNHRLDVR